MTTGLDALPIPPLQEERFDVVQLDRVRGGDPELSLIHASGHVEGDKLLRTVHQVQGWRDARQAWKECECRQTSE